MSSNDAALLGKQKELLMERLSDFEATNRTLRKMLRDRHEREASSLRMAEQRDLLLKKLSETEDLYQRLRSEVLDKDRQLADFRLQLDAQRVKSLCLFRVPDIDLPVGFLLGLQFSCLLYICRTRMLLSMVFKHRWKIPEVICRNS